jgi:excinuclease UvrABC nuclease subunit
MRADKGQLVSQHLENISRTALEKYQTILKDYVKGRHGVYALYRKGHLYYVGLASNLRNRLKTHLKDRHAQTWDSFSVYLTINDSHLHELETLILKIASPKGNKQSGNFMPKT